ncbi:MAG: hypothetical protein WDZ35_09725 [Crocinitomicaceae bacterium]
MKWINIFTITIGVFLFCSLGRSQKEYNPWMGKSKLMVGYYHFGSYEKERPIIGLEQTIEYVIHPKFRTGIGLGVNIYPGKLTFPVFATAKYIQQLKRFGFYFIQSYGINTGFGDIGFFSHRNYGAFGVNIRLKENLTLDPEIGYLLNWDKHGPGSLSLTTGLGLYYSL